MGVVVVVVDLINVGFTEVVPTWDGSNHNGILYILYGCSFFYNACSNIVNVKKRSTTMNEPIGGTHILRTNRTMPVKVNLHSKLKQK